MQRSVKISGSFGIAALVGIAMIVSAGCSHQSNGQLSNLTPTQMNQKMLQSSQNYAAFRQQQMQAKAQASGQQGQAGQ